MLFIGVFIATLAVLAIVWVTISNNKEYLMWVNNIE